VLRYFFGKRNTLFGHEHSGTLSLFRFLYCALVIVEILGSANYRDSLYEKTDYSPIPFLAEIYSEPLPQPVFEALRMVTIVALAFASLGLLTRPALIVSLIAFTLYEGFFLGFTKPKNTDYVYHMSNLTVFALFLMAIAPGVARHGITSLVRRRNDGIAIPEWPRKTLIGMLAFAYFGAGYCKLVESLLWVDGYTLQGYLFDRGIRHDLDLALALGQYHGLCVVLSVLTVLLEITFPLILIWPRLAWLYVAGGLQLHVMIHFTMDINFFHYFAFNYLAFVEWPFLVASFRRIAGRAKAEEPPASQAVVPTPQRAIAISLIALQAACVVFHVESWPLSDFRVYSKRRHPDMVSVLFLAKTGDSGEEEWLADNRQQRFRRAVGHDVANALAAAFDLEEPDRSAAIALERPRIYTAMMESDPKFFRRHRTLTLHLKSVELDPADGRYKAVTRFVCDLPPAE
jgi:hypothetical protein